MTLHIDISDICIDQQLCRIYYTATLLYKPLSEKDACEKAYTILCTIFDNNTVEELLRYVP